jgi:hypothetical protein
METLYMIVDACEQAKNFLLNSVSVPNMPFGVKRCSEFHNTEKFPDMQLVATYNASHALKLLGAYEDIPTKDRMALIDFINGYQMENGVYRLPMMKDDEIWKGISVAYSRAYIDSHITNYAMGVVKSLGGDVLYPFSYIHDLLDEEALRNWLDQRDLSNPWLEGNNVVNLASLMIHELEGKNDDRLRCLIEVLFDWHERMQDPETGFWGTNHPVRPASLLEGMAGACHNFHLYYYFNRPIGYIDRIVDYCLDFLSAGVQSACLDVDVVDVLANFLVYGYRVQDIRNALEGYVPKLRAFQNRDGGFADEKNGLVRRMDGWVYGYWEPQGLSNCFATWFRTVTLAMIASVLYPHTCESWHFRTTIGMGYFSQNYLK